MLAEYQTITTTPLLSNQILFQGELKALWVMSSKGKMLQYFKNQVTGNVLQSFQHFKSDFPEIPTRMVSGGNVLHLHYTSKKGRREAPFSQIPSNARVDKRSTELLKQ